MIKLQCPTYGIFEVVGEINFELPKEIHQEIIIESFEFFDVSIKELIRNNFPQLDFDCSNMIIGYLVYKKSEGYLRKAKWVNNKFEWLIIKKRFMKVVNEIQFKFNDVRVIF